MVYLYEALIGAGLVLLCWWLARLGGGGRGWSMGLAAAVLAAYFWPWVVYADWGLVARAALVLAVAAALVLGYARVLARIRAAARERDGEP